MPPKKIVASNKKKKRGDSVEGEDKKKRQGRSEKVRERQSAKETKFGAPSHTALSESLDRGKQKIVLKKKNGFAYSSECSHVLPSKPIMFASKSEKPKRISLVLLCLIFFLFVVWWCFGLFGIVNLNSFPENDKSQEKPVHKAHQFSITLSDNAIEKRGPTTSTMTKAAIATKRIQKVIRSSDEPDVRNDLSAHFSDSFPSTKHSSPFFRPPSAFSSFFLCLMKTFSMLILPACLSFLPFLYFFRNSFRVASLIVVLAHFFSFFATFSQSKVESEKGRSKSQKIKKSSASSKIYPNKKKKLSKNAFNETEKFKKKVAEGSSSKKECQQSRASSVSAGSSERRFIRDSGCRATLIDDKSVHKIGIPFRTKNKEVLPSRKKRKKQLIEKKKPTHIDTKKSFARPFTVHKSTKVRKKIIQHRSSFAQPAVDPFKTDSVDFAAERKKSLRFPSTLVSWYQKIFKRVRLFFFPTKYCDLAVSSSSEAINQKPEESSPENENTCLLKQSNFVDYEWQQIDTFLRNTLPDYQFIQGSCENSSVTTWWNNFSASTVQSEAHHSSRSSRSFSFDSGSTISSIASSECLFPSSLDFFEANSLPSACCFSSSFPCSLSEDQEGQKRSNKTPAVLYERENKASNWSEKCLPCNSLLRNEQFFRVVEVTHCQGTYFPSTYLSPSFHHKRRDSHQERVRFSPRRPSPLSFSSSSSSYDSSIMSSSPFLGRNTNGSPKEPRLSSSSLEIPKNEVELRQSTHLRTTSNGLPPTPFKGHTNPASSTTSDATGTPLSPIRIIVSQDKKSIRKKRVGSSARLNPSSLTQSNSSKTMDSSSSRKAPIGSQRKRMDDSIRTPLKSSINEDSSRISTTLLHPPKHTVKNPGILLSSRGASSATTPSRGKGREEDGSPTAERNSSRPRVVLQTEVSSARDYPTNDTVESHPYRIHVSKPGTTAPLTVPSLLTTPRSTVGSTRLSTMASPQSGRKKFERLVSVEEQLSSSRRAPALSSRSVGYSSGPDGKIVERTTSSVSARRPILSMERHRETTDTKTDDGFNSLGRADSLSLLGALPSSRGMPSVMTVNSVGLVGESTSGSGWSGTLQSKPNLVHGQNDKVQQSVNPSKAPSSVIIDDSPDAMLPMHSGFTSSTASAGNRLPTHLFETSYAHSSTLRKNTTSASGNTPRQTRNLPPTNVGARRTVHQMEANPHAPSSTSAQFFPPPSVRSKRVNSQRGAESSSPPLMSLDPKNLQVEIIDDFRDEAYKMGGEEDECDSAVSSMNSSYCGSPRSRDGTPKMAKSSSANFSKMPSLNAPVEEIDDEEPFVYDRVQEEAAVSHFFSVGSLNFGALKTSANDEDEERFHTLHGPLSAQSLHKAALQHSQAADSSAVITPTFSSRLRSLAPQKEGIIFEPLGTSSSFLALQESVSQKTMTLSPLPDLNEDYHTRNEIIQQIVSRASFIAGVPPVNVNENRLSSYDLVWDPPLGEDGGKLEGFSKDSSTFPPSTSEAPIAQKSVTFSLPKQKEKSPGEGEEADRAAAAPISSPASTTLSTGTKGRPPLSGGVAVTSPSNAKSKIKHSPVDLKTTQLIHANNELLLKAAKSRGKIRQCRLLSLYEAFYLDRRKNKWLVDDDVLAKCLEYVGLMGYEHPQLKKDRSKLQPSIWSSSASIPSPLVEVASSVAGTESVHAASTADLCFDGVLRRYRLSHKPSCHAERVGTETLFLAYDEAMRWINSKEYVIGAILMVCAEARFSSSPSGSSIPHESHTSSSNAPGHEEGRIPQAHSSNSQKTPATGHNRSPLKNMNTGTTSSCMVPCIPPNIHPIFWVALHVSTFYPQWGDISHFSNLWETQVRLVLTPASPSRQKTIRLIEDGLTFSSDREGGNLAAVQREVYQDPMRAFSSMNASIGPATVLPPKAPNRSGTPFVTAEPEYQVWLEPDLNSDKRIWFRFSIAGAVEGRRLYLKLMNAAPHLKLYETNGMRPVWRDGLVQVHWAPVDVCHFQLVDDGTNAELSFQIVPRSSTETIQVAFCAPYTYSDLLCHLVHWHELVKEVNACCTSSQNPIRFEERVLGYSTEGRKQHVLLISSPFNAPVTEKDEARNKLERNPSCSSPLPSSPSKMIKKSIPASSRKNSASFSLCSTAIIPASSRSPSTVISKHVDPLLLSPDLEPISIPTAPIPSKIIKSSRKKKLKESDSNFSSARVSLMHQPVEVLSPFSNFSSGKKVVLISGRVHPGEVTASHGLHGLITYLLSNDPGAVALRDHFMFLIVPMLNPDGVSRGHSRMDQFGVNLNRSYNKPDPFMEPTIYHLKKLFEGLLSVYGERFFIYIDFHSHASQSTSFMFGNQLPVEVNHWNKAFPRLVEIHASNLFEYSVCRFSKGHMSTKDGASRVLFGLSLIHSYTIELPHFTDRTMFTEQLSGMLTGRFFIENSPRSVQDNASRIETSPHPASVCRSSTSSRTDGRSVSEGSFTMGNPYGGASLEKSMMESSSSIITSSRRLNLMSNKKGGLNSQAEGTGRKGRRSQGTQNHTSHLELSSTVRGSSTTSMPTFENGGGILLANSASGLSRSDLDGICNESISRPAESPSSRLVKGGKGGASSISGRRSSRRLGFGVAGGKLDSAVDNGGCMEKLQPIFIPSVLRQSALVGISTMRALLDYTNLGPAMDKGSVELPGRLSGGKIKGSFSATSTANAASSVEMRGESALLKQYGGIEKVLSSVRVAEKAPKAEKSGKATPSAGKKKKKKVKEAKN